MQLFDIPVMTPNPGHFGCGSFRPESFRPIWGGGCRFGLGRWVISANILGELIRPQVISAKVYGNSSVLYQPKAKFIFWSTLIFVDLYMIFAYEMF